MHRCCSALIKVQSLAFGSLLIPLAALALDCGQVPHDLHDMVAVDQAIRGHLTAELDLKTGAPSQAMVEQFEQMNIVDSSNTARLKQMLATCGWPKQSLLGKDASHDAWLLAQHADLDPRFQAQAVKLLDAAVKQGEAAATDMAYLADRVSLAAKKPQLYGTQFDVHERCELTLRPVDDVAKVEARRKALGMPSLDEYRQQVLLHAMPPECAHANREVATGQAPLPKP